MESEWNLLTKICWILTFINQIYNLREKLEEGIIIAKILTGETWANSQENGLYKYLMIMCGIEIYKKWFLAKIDKNFYHRKWENNYNFLRHKLTIRFNKFYFIIGLILAKVYSIFIWLWSVMK
jgi:hypothetical protein